MTSGEQRMGEYKQLEAMILLAEDHNLEQSEAKNLGQADEE